MTILRTERLTLRPARESDAGRFAEILSNWNVIRMMRLAPHPYTEELARAWIETHAPEREAGSAHRFAIERDGRLIGTCDVDEIANGVGDLGYWLEEPAWGQGIASEAARAVMAFAFDGLRLGRLTSGHAADNPASGKVLTKLGFGRVGQARVWSTPRACEIDQIKYERGRP